MTGFIQMVMAELALGSDLLTTEILLTVADFAIGPAAAGLMCVSRFAIVWVWHQMRHTFQLSCQVRGPVKNRGDIRGPARSDAACEVF